MLGVVWLLQRRVARGGTGNGGTRTGGMKNGAPKDRTRDPVRIVAKRGIGAKAQLVVVDVDDVRYVLGVTDGGITVIDQHPAAEEAPAHRTIAAVAPITALPFSSAATGSAAISSAATDSAPTRDAHEPLPLRRTHAQRRTGSAARSTSLAGFLQKDAAQVLRRALGA